jgi:hypothetical protein
MMGTCQKCWRQEQEEQFWNIASKSRDDVKKVASRQPKKGRKEALFSTVQILCEAWRTDNHDSKTKMHYRMWLLIFSGIGSLTWKIFIDYGTIHTCPLLPPLHSSCSFGLNLFINYGIWDNTYMPTTATSLFSLYWSQHCLGGQFQERKGIAWGFHWLKNLTKMQFKANSLWRAKQ